MTPSGSPHRADPVNSPPHRLDDLALELRGFAAWCPAIVDLPLCLTTAVYPKPGQLQLAQLGTDL